MLRVEVFQQCAARAPAISLMLTSMTCLHLAPSLFLHQVLMLQPTPPSGLPHLLQHPLPVAVLSVVVCDTFPMRTLMPRPTAVKPPKSGTST